MTKRAALLALAIIPCAVPACVTALGVDGYQDAIVELCKCNVALDFLGDRCLNTLQMRITNASPEVRSAWLTFYDTHDCNAVGSGQCLEAYACYAQAGTCSLTYCEEDQECCGYNNADSPTQCQANECVSP